MDNFEWPPPEGSAYVAVSSDADRLGEFMAEKLPCPRLASFVGDPNGPEIAELADKLGREMFQVENIVIIPL